MCIGNVTLRECLHEIDHKIVTALCAITEMPTNAVTAKQKHTL